MKVVIQRVSQASVTVDAKIVADIQKGLLVLVGIEDADTQEDIDWLCQKTANLRIFGDENDVMNLSVKEINGEIIVVSQFTLQASTKKGNRPSYIKASKPEIAIPMYENFVQKMEKLKERLVMEIGNAEDLSAALKLYTSFYLLIPEYKFVFSW